MLLQQLIFHNSRHCTLMKQVCLKETFENIEEKRTSLSTETEHGRLHFSCMKQ